jgi:hypothetical protein
LWDPILHESYLHYMHLISFSGWPDDGQLTETFCRSKNKNINIYCFVWLKFETICFLLVKLNKILEHWWNNTDREELTCTLCAPVHHMHHTEWRGHGPGSLVASCVWIFAVVVLPLRSELHSAYVWRKCAPFKSFK